MTRKSEKKDLGQVCLVGAGPGDPQLITVAGLDRLRRAQVVVFDALANPALLERAPRSAERIGVGKRAGRHKLSQDQINDLLVAKAREGRFVVRLKGGDPYLFGRGAEEAAHLARHGIDCEVIAGVSAGIAAPAAAGIPVTHRSWASTVSFVTAHEDPVKADSAVDYQALARLIGAGGTACFFMGAGRLAEIAGSLMGFGLGGQTPAAVVQWGTLPRQASVRAALSSIAGCAEQAALGSPSILVVGSVARLDEPGLDYFTRRPLFGHSVLVTRTRRQASQLREQLEALGAEVLEAPTLKLVPPADWSEVDQVLRDIGDYDWLVLTSVNGVRVLAARLADLGLDGRHLRPVFIAAIGQATAQALHRRLRLRADLVPARFVAESLAAEMIRSQDLAGKKVLLLRADIARPALPNLLVEAGAQVREIIAYQTKLAPCLPARVLDALRRKRIGWVAFASSSTVKNLVELLGEERGLLDEVSIASIGPITTEAAHRLGLTVCAEAEQFDIAGLVEAIVAAIAPSS